jgi:hypothetical protein
LFEKCGHGWPLVDLPKPKLPQAFATIQVTAIPDGSQQQTPRMAAGGFSEAGASQTFATIQVTAIPDRSQQRTQ